MKSISTVEGQPKWPGMIENKSKRIPRKKKNLAKNGRKDKWCTAEERINNLKIKAEGISQYSTQKTKETENIKEMLRHGI